MAVRFRLDVGCVSHRSEAGRSSGAHERARARTSPLTRADQNVTTVKPGKFQLVMHVGGVENTGAVGDLQANVKTVDLQPPANATRVDSWAALVE